MRLAESIVDIGIVEALFRYPVKSMRGEVLERIYGIPMGILPHPSGGAPVSFVI